MTGPSPLRWGIAVGLGLGVELGCGDPPPECEDVRPVVATYVVTKADDREWVDATFETFRESGVDRLRVSLPLVLRTSDEGEGCLYELE